MDQANIAVNSVTQGDVIDAIVAERDLQDQMWGNQTHDPAYWLAILGKQVGQLGSAVLKYKWADIPIPVEMYDEAKQAAAVLVAFMEAIEEDRLSDEVTSVRPEPRKLAAALNRGDESIGARGVTDCGAHGQAHRKDGTCCDVAYAARPPVAPKDLCGAPAVEMMPQPKGTPCYYAPHHDSVAHSWQLVGDSSDRKPRNPKTKIGEGL